MSVHQPNFNVSEAAYTEKCVNFCSYTMPIIWCDIQVIKRFLQPFLLLLSRCWPFTGDAQFNAQIAVNNKLRPHLASSTRGKMSIFVHLVIQTCMGNFFFFQITCRKMPPGDPYHSELKRIKWINQRNVSKYVSTSIMDNYFLAFFLHSVGPFIEKG